MNQTFYFLIFILGAIVGSFLNVVILRYNTGLPILHTKARSKCFSCGKTLAWKELIPILSYVFQKGRCTNCKSKISIQYPLVEILSGIFFLLSFNLYKDLAFSDAYTFLIYFLISVITVSLLLIIAVYDIRHKIIPNGLVYTFILLHLFSFFISHKTFFFFQPDILWNFLAGPIFFSIFFALWYISKGTWLGFGDVKLVLGIGFMLGLYKGTSALLLAFWIGALVSLAILAIQKVRLRTEGKALTMKSEIPFAPFLIAGTLLVYYFAIDALKLGSLFTS